MNATVAAVSQDLIAAQLPAPIEGYARYVYVDGVFAPSLSDPAPAGAQAAIAAQGAELVVGPNTAARCVELMFVATRAAQEGASNPHFAFTVESDTRGALIERHLSVGSEDSVVQALVEVSLEKGSTLEHYRVQQTGLRAQWNDALFTTVDQNANYRLCSVQLGAQTARSNLEVQLIGERAQVALSVVAVTGRRQMHSLDAVVHHRAAHTHTEQTFRGIASSRGRTTFNGKVVVYDAAVGANSQQSLRGLLAGSDAEINVRPHLEIYTDDVRCSHGATVGKLDENMLFYLLSRGLEREMAERLLKWAFLEDVIAKVAVPELRTQIEHSLPDGKELT